MRTARALVDQGRSAKDAISSLRPPVFWNKKLDFERQLKRWSTNQLNDLLERLQDAEVLCKTTGYPAMTITSPQQLGLGLQGPTRAVATHEVLDCEFLKYIIKLF